VHEQTPEHPVLVPALLRIRESPTPGWVIVERQREQLNDSIGVSVGHLPNA
jgi:hypothetical protein